MAEIQPMRPGNLRRGGGAPSHGGRTVGSRRPTRETRAIRCSETQSSPRTGLGREKSLNLNRGLAIQVDFRVESAPLRRCWGSWGGPARNQPLSCLSGTVQTLAEHHSPGPGLDTSPAATTRAGRSVVGRGTGRLVQAVGGGVGPNSLGELGAAGAAAAPTPTIYIHASGCAH